jgi:hypothetical protein
MGRLEGFELDADISISELRRDDVLDQRLRDFRQLRLRRRNDTLGVVVAADYWRFLAAYVRDLEAQVERYEDAAAGAIVAQRAPHAEFVAGTPDVIEAIDAQYRLLLAGD